MFERFWPIGLAILSEIFYQIASKSTPSRVNVFASVTLTYLIGAAVSALIYFIQSGGGNIFTELKNANWTALLLGVAIVGLEGGSIFMYKVGWNVNTGFVVKAIVVAVALVFVGGLLYKERIDAAKLIGIALCMAGLFFINRY